MSLLISAVKLLCANIDSIFLYDEAIDIPAPVPQINIPLYKSDF